MDVRQINEEYAKIGQDLINTEVALQHLVDAEVSIVYLSSSHEKKTKFKTIFGECEKIPDRYKWAIPADFAITIFEPNIEGFTEEQIRILIFHELLHIGINPGSDGEKFALVPHDIEDFALIIDRYGRDWNKKGEWPTILDEKALSKMKIKGV